MKKFIVAGFIVAVCLLVIPLLSAKNKKSSAVRVAATVKEVKENLPEVKGDSFRIKVGDKVETLSAQEYLIGVVSAEMPASFEDEALKAQTVAAYSFALYRKQRNKDKDFDLTDSYKTDQSYLTPDALKEKWGEAYGEKTKKIKAAVLAVEGEYLSYEGEPALALYHAVSSGVTNACKDVFGSDLPYLVPADSQSDTLSPDYSATFVFSDSELNEKLASLKKQTGTNLLTSLTADKNGLVREALFAGETVSGSKISGLLGLPSPNFVFEYKDGPYTFTSKGRGHGVGLSQYGANQMALTGSNYREILAHYYKGAKLQKN